MARAAHRVSERHAAGWAVSAGPPIGVDPVPKGALLGARRRGVELGQVRVRVRVRIGVKVRVQVKVRVRVEVRARVRVRDGVRVRVRVKVTAGRYCS